MEVHIAETAAALGARAAHDIAASLREMQQQQKRIRVIFAAAPSQSEMLTALLREPGIDWSRVTAFHMDEYLGLNANAPQGFGNWLKREFFDHVPMGAVHLIGPGDDAQEACRSYGAMLDAATIDMVLLGIGTNGHLAFNDPPADLTDPAVVRVVTLDAMCRQQQVGDGCFATLEEVPRQAITLTVPTLLAAKKLFCCVPGSHKSQAVHAMMHAPVSGDCPATALRTHSSCEVYLDRASAVLLSEQGDD